MSRVLIAEDNAVNRELLRELLESRGHIVIEACNGRDALESARRERPDIILLDLGMPVMDGFTTLANLRKDASLKSLPVVAVTAYAMQGDREKALSAGFDGYLTKPIHVPSLIAELERHLNGQGVSKARGQTAGQ